MLSRGTRGAVSELQACVYLMNKGYHVFRAQSPSCPFDLVAYNAGRCIRVEVKTLTRVEPYDSLGYAQPRNDEWDLLIVVDPGGECFEFLPGYDYRETIKEIGLCTPL